jgi:hypothetical protein
MRKMYFKLLVGLIIILWVIYYIQSYKPVLDEGFTSKINALYRPYVRHINKRYETFMNKYGSNLIIHKLKRWNII